MAGRYDGRRPDRRIGTSSSHPATPIFHFRTAPPIRPVQSPPYRLSDRPSITLADLPRPAITDKRTARYCIRLPASINQSAKRTPNLPAATNIPRRRKKSVQSSAECSVRFLWGRLPSGMTAIPPIPDILTGPMLTFLGMLIPSVEHRGTLG